MAVVSFLSVVSAFVSVLSVSAAVALEVVVSAVVSVAILAVVVLVSVGKSCRRRRRRRNGSFWTKKSRSDEFFVSWRRPDIEVGHHPRRHRHHLYPFQSWESVNYVLGVVTVLACRSCHGG